ncbi:MAG: hypothetical protein AW12_01668 [Candidatus Accumulibacter sp. BA-94]|nr:MAG: hypothetical protein AW12_01668 [Candidatus Accumulibacter sp. BA-94]
MEGQHQLAQQSLATQRSESDPGHLVTARRHQSRFHAIRSTHPDDTPVSLAQQVRHCQTGKDMATGATRHDQQGSHSFAPRIS